MRTQVLNLDDAIVEQEQFLEACRPEVIDVAGWGPRLRIGCAFRSFRRFERLLDRLLPIESEPTLTFVGSGDFHHVSLALVRRIEEPFVLLMLDNHPDWMAGIPFLHCGTWVHHALKLPNLEHLLHLGGGTDFDNGFRWLAPRRHILRDRITVVPGGRTFRGGFWDEVPHRPLRAPGESRLSDDQLEAWAAFLAPRLAGRAVYVTFDKDVLCPADAVVNWDSGILRLVEVLDLLSRLFERSRARLIGMDVVGDWSPVQLKGILRRVLHYTEHPADDICPQHARRINEDANLCIADFVRGLERVSRADARMPRRRNAV
jgi:hypothetical protein